MHTDNDKISPAFQTFLAEAGPKERREGIVVYRAPRTREGQAGSVLEFRRRQAAVRSRAPEQKKVEAELYEGVRKLGKSIGGEEVTFTGTGGGAIPVAKIEVTPKMLPELARRPDVVAIMPNQRVRLIRPKEVDYARLDARQRKDGITWGLKQLAVPEVWPKSKGKGVRVAVLDSGVYGAHAALDGRVRDFVVIDSAGRRVPAKLPFDCGSHGTHVCGTIAGGKVGGKVAVGVAPEAELLVGAVLTGDSTLHMLIQGLAWAVESGANVVCLSLGFDYYEPKFTTIFEDLLDYGVVPVVAIGNENHGNSSSPGNAWNALSVGAVEKMPGGRLDVAPFSSGASLVFPGSETNALVTKPDVVAPGVQVLSAVPPVQQGDGPYQHAYMNGTSMATPHAAGVAALLMSAKPLTPARAIIEVVKATAKHTSQTNRPDNRWGYGLVQPVEALKALG
jgi:subtilisin family serine protease